MKKILGLLIIFTTIITTSIDVEAKANIGAIQNGGYTSLSYQDKCDTVTALVSRVAKDLGITKPIRTHFYSWPDGAMVAYTYTNPNDIYINMSIFDNDIEATNNGLTVEQYLVKVIAHEVRHVYQDEHKNDDTDYGRQCLANHYITYQESLTGYETQFVEVDADAYGLDYAMKFVKVKTSKTPKQLIANDGKIFNPIFYANRYPDVKNALGTDPQALLNHYNTYGIKEGRLPNNK